MFLAPAHLGWQGSIPCFYCAAAFPLAETPLCVWWVLLTWARYTSDKQSCRQGLGASRSGGTGLPALNLSPASGWGDEAGAGRHMPNHQLSWAYSRGRAIFVVGKWFGGRDVVWNASFLASVDHWFLENLGPISCGFKMRKKGLGQQSGLLLITLFSFLSTGPTATLLPKEAGRDMGGL